MSRISSPARSEGALGPRQSKVRRTMSVTSARSEASVRLTSVVEQVIQSDELKWPLRRSVLPDDTNIDMPRRASWWKRLEGSSRDVLEALDTNKMEVNLLLEDFEIEVQKKTHHSVQESSDNESIASIVVPPRRLFNQKKQSQGKFGDNMGSRISLGRTNLEDHENTINVMPKNLFKQGQPMNRPVFPAALLNSTNKTVNQTVDPETDKQGRKLFGQAGTKRKKNMFTDFVLSESEDDSEVQYQVFGFKKNDNKRISLASRSRRMPSLTPSVTTDIDIDDWNLLPSSTMIGNGSGPTEISGIITDKDIEQAQDENADVTLTDANETLKPESETNNKSKTKEKQSLNRTRFSRKQSDEFEKTLNDEVVDIVQASKKYGVDEIVKLDDVNNSVRSNKTLRSEVYVDKTMETESSNTAEIIQFKEDSKILQYNTAEITKSEHINVTSNEKVLESTKQANSKHGVIDESDVLDKAPKNGNINEQKTVNEPSVEEKMAELHEECEDIENSAQKSDPRIEYESQISSKETSNENQDEDMEEMVWNENDDDKASDKTEEIDEDQNEKDTEHDLDNQNLENDEQDLSEHAASINDVPDKSQKIVESSVECEKIEQENDVVDETPNTTYDTTGRNRKKTDAQVKSPEAILNNMSKENMSFKPMGRSTSFRKSKSPIDDVNARRTLIPIQESIVGSDGSRNSSSEGSGWDSHRTTRKTLRQTFGKDFTPRKSLRALVMAKSAKRQTDGGKDTSKINKMINKQNKTALEDQPEDVRNRHVSIRNLSSEQLSNPKSPVPEISAHHVSDPLIAEPQISYHKSVHEVFNDSGPEISMNASYGTGMSRESLDNASEDHFRTSKQKSTVKKDFVRVETDCEMQEELDYDPSVQEDFISEASSRNIAEHKNSGVVKQVLETQNTLKQKNSDKEQSDYDASKQEIVESEQEQESWESIQEIEAESEQEEEHEKTQPEIEAESEQEEENEETQQEIEVESDQEEENEETQQEIEVESEQEEEHEDSQQEIEVESEQEEEHEETQQEIEVESEQEEEHIDTQQEIEVESEQEEEHEDTQQEIETESEHEEHEDTQNEIEAESEQEEEHEETQQEIVAESDEEQDNEDSEQEIEAEFEQEQSREHIESQETVDVSENESGQESNHIYDGPDREMDSNHEQDDQEDAQNEMSKRFTERVVFDNEMSDQEIDYELSERVSRQITDIEISEQVSDDEIEGGISGVSGQADDHDISLGTQKSMLVMQMQKIVQENKEIRQKIREEVQNSLQQKRLAYNQMSPMQSKYSSSIRRLKMFEPTKPKRKPKTTTTFAMKGLPKEFMEDLKYKPPKRFQPANAPWITKRLYKYLETKLEPKYDYRARVRAEQLVQNIYEFTKLVRRRDLAPQNAVDELKKEMARLNIVHTHFEFHEFFHEFMPREIRIKVNPDIVNRIPLPRNGIFGDILQSQPIVD